MIGQDVQDALSLLSGVADDPQLFSKALAVPALPSSETMGPVIARAVEPKSLPPRKASTATPPEALYLEQRQRLLSAAREQVAMLRRLTTYRRANEELQNSFLALERHMPPGAALLEMIFADDRQSAEARLTLGWGSPGLGQVLPVSSVGLSAICLSFFGIAPRPGALLRIHLCSIEDQQVIDRWSIPLDRLTPGWTMLSLTSALVGATRTLDLRLDLDGQADCAVSLHLGSPQRVRLFQVRNTATDTAMQQNGLAMQIWSGEPFGAFARQIKVIVADARREGPHGLRLMPLAPMALAKASLANAEDVTFAFAPVSYVAYRAAVSCHPPRRGLTIASLPLPPRMRAMGFAADVEIGNEKSAPVEFALALAADAARAKALFQGAATAEDEACSDWRVASFASGASLATAVQRQPREPLQAFIATRMAKPGANDFAWARFRNLSLAASPG